MCDDVAAAPTRRPIAPIDTDADAIITILVMARDLILCFGFFV